MSVGKIDSADASATHLEPETFQDFAYAELQDCPVNVAGVCFRPDCSKKFNATRTWQIYCSIPCLRADKAEMRKWGNKVGWPLLLWRRFKYSKEPKQAALVRKARKYITHVQTAWMHDGQARIEMTTKGHSNEP